MGQSYYGLGKRRVSADAIKGVDKYYSEISKKNIKSVPGNRFLEMCQSQPQYMVINRWMNRGRRRFKFPRAPRFTPRGVLNWIIADPSGRKRRRGPTISTTTRKTTLTKRATSTAGIANITSTVQTDALSGIAAGVGNANRNHNEIYLRKFRMTGVLHWDTGGTPCDVLRLLIYNAEVGSTPALTVQSNPYGRVDFPEINHVLYDRLFVRGSSALTHSKILIRLPLGGLKIKYNSDAVTETNRQLLMSVVSDTANCTSDFVDMRWTLTWRE